MAFANNENLMELVGTTIFDHGVEDFTDELNRAESDVKRYIEVNWFKETYATKRKLVGSTVGSVFDATLLTETQWTHGTIYLAMYRYILPRLSPFRGEDSFSNQISFYKERYFEEIREEMAKGVEYDANDDGVVTEAEKHTHRKDRVYR